MKGTSYKKDTKIDGKVVIITGANSGIGKTTAIDLARRGGKIYIACRDKTRGEEALKDIKKQSGSENVHLLELDLASTDSIREFSRKFHERESYLHILINNAGVMGCSKELTKDGFEMHMGTNHLGHFLLTNLLMDLLKQTSSSRIVVVSAMLHIFGAINKDDLMSENSYNKYRAYCHSKLANNLFTHELSKKLQGTGVTINVLHPGVIVTEIQRFAAESAVMKYILEAVGKLFLKSPEEGAQTTIYLAVDPDVKVSGKYFNDCKEKQPSADSTNDELSAWLWKKSEELLGLNYV